MAARRLNAEMEERKDEREERWVAILQSAWTQESRNFVTTIRGPHINDEGLNYYTS